MKILAHRANRAGIDARQENTLEAVRACLEQGWGIETDIRRNAAGRYYISHDPVAVTERNQVEAFCVLLREMPSAVVALNVKELGYEADLVRFLERQRVLGQVFLFDMELIEPTPGETARLLRSLHPTVKLAARVSDRDEPVERALGIEVADIIWLDEFDRLWATEADIRTLKKSGRTIYAVSPEIHGFTPEEMRRRWSEFRKWGVDGICTDFPEELARSLAK
jgi:glycerophosphoryl diester phosphodiesterase